MPWCSKEMICAHAPLATFVMQRCGFHDSTLPLSLLFEDSTRRMWTGVSEARYASALPQ